MAQDLSKSGPALRDLQGSTAMIAASSPSGFAATSILLGDSRDDRVGTDPPGTWPDSGSLPLDHPGASYQPPAQDPGWEPDTFRAPRFAGGGWDVQPYPQLTRFGNEGQG